MEKFSKKEKSDKLEEGMESSRKNSSLYLKIVTILFILVNISALTPLTGIPVFFYNHRYLCKNPDLNNTFNIQCFQNDICSNNKTLNIDYIIDQKRETNIKSFITSFNISCSTTKKTLLASSFFFGQLIGTIIYPYLISHLGIIDSLIINYFLIFVSYLIMAKYTYYYITLIFYNISSLSFQIVMLGFKQYIVEMSESSKRPIYLLFNLLSQILSGFFVILVSYIYLDYRYLLVICSFICIVGLILVQMFVVESIRILFAQGKIDKLMENLEYISKINKSLEPFNEWKENAQNIFYDNSNNNYLNLNDEKSKALIDNNNIKNDDEIYLNEINYISVWNYPSQVKIIILFSFATFYVNYSLVLAQFEISKQNKFFLSLLEAYTCDMIGYFFGIIITKIKNGNRKVCFLFLNSLLTIMFLVESIYYSSHNQFFFIFFRIFINSMDANFNLYNFESFPTLSRSVGVAINRFFGKFFNIFTPLIMINFEKIGFLCGMLFGGILFLLSIFLSPKETNKHLISEFPIEIIREYKKEIIKKKPNEKENNDEDDYLLI